MSSNETAATAPEAVDSALLGPTAGEAPASEPSPASDTTAAGSDEGAPAPAKPELSPAQCMALLVEHFPALFVALPPPGTPHQGAAPKPLKLRIQADLQQRLPGVFTRKALSLTLHRYTTTTPYLRALVQSPTRFDLDGQAAGDLSDEHRQAAQTELDRRKALVAERRAAQRAAGPRDAGRNDAEGAGEPRPRPPRRPPEGAPRGERARRDGAPGPVAPRGPRPLAGGRPTSGDRADRPPRLERPERSPRTDRPARAEPRDRGEVRDNTPNAVLPGDPAPRERAQLLRAWEGTALTKRNFCMLKGLSEADFDVQIAQAQQERGARR